MFSMESSFWRHMRIRGLLQIFIIINETRIKTPPAVRDRFHGLRTAYRFFYAQRFSFSFSVYRFYVLIGFSCKLGLLF